MALTSEMPSSQFETANRPKYSNVMFVTKFTSLWVLWKIISPYLENCRAWVSCWDSSIFCSWDFRKLDTLDQRSSRKTLEMRPLIALLWKFLQSFSKCSTIFEIANCQNFSVPSPPKSHFLGKFLHLVMVFWSTYGPLLLNTS